MNTVTFATELQFLNRDRPITGLDFVTKVFKHNIFLISIGGTICPCYP